MAARLAPVRDGTETNGSITAPLLPAGWSGSSRPSVASRRKASSRFPGPRTPPGRWRDRRRHRGPARRASAGTETTAPRPRGPRPEVGVPRDLWGSTPAADDAAERGLSGCSAAGAENRRGDQCRRAEGPRRAARAHDDAGRAQGVASTDLGRDREVKTLDDVIAFNRAHADTELPWFGQSLLEQAVRPRASRRRRTSRLWSVCTAAGLAELDRVSVSTSWTPSSPRHRAGHPDRPGERRPMRRWLVRTPAPWRGHR